MKGTDVRVTIGGVEFQGFETISFGPSAQTRAPERDQRRAATRELMWAGWFDRVWEQAGRRRDPGAVGLPLEAVRLGHRRMARGELEPFPRPEN